MSQANNSQEVEHILKSRYKAVPIPSLDTVQNVAQFLLDKAEENSKKGLTNWMTDSLSNVTITFDQIGPLSSRLASAMKKRGMVKGDVALYLTSDVTKIYLTMIGIWRCGGCLYSSYVEDTQEHLTMRIKESKARWIFCDASSVAQCKAAVQNVQDWSVEIFVFGDAAQAHDQKAEVGTIDVNVLFEDDGKACPTNVETTHDDPVLIMCTSGTTGLSKGAVYTNQTVLAFCLGSEAIPWSAKPSLYLIKCTHVLGVLFPIRNINGGNWTIMMPQILKQNVYKAVDKYKPFLVFGFPTYLIALVTDTDAMKYDRSSVEIMCTGGMVITATIYETLMKLPSMKAVINGYGMTECGGVTTTIDLAHSQEIRAVPNLPPLTVGLLYPNTELKIIDLSTGQTLGPNQHGEIAFKTPVASTSYLNRPEESKCTFENGWIRSGDLGYYDRDGFLFVVDRIKETFKYFNNHISPVELEELLLQHPQVHETSVIGIVDPEGGDRIPRAFVVLKSGVAEGNVDVEEIRQFVDDKVAPYKKIRGGLYVVPSLPRGKTGKVLRSLVAEIPLPSK